MTITPAERLWYATEYAYKTNDVATYKFMRDAESQLEAMEKKRPRDLDYNYCLAFLNGRLFVRAQTLRYTNAAAEYLLKSGYYFNENRRDAHMPMTNFSPETIEYYIELRDARLRTNELDTSTNSTRKGVIH